MGWINSVLSDYVLLALLVGCGVFFTIRTRFVQCRCFGEGLRNVLGKINCGYLFGRRSTLVYSGLAVAFIFCGTLMKSDLVWKLQDLLNQLMVLPNVAALIALSGAVAAAARRE